MGEAIRQSETLRRWTWREIVQRGVAAVRRLPHVVAIGWCADSTRRSLFAPALVGAGTGLYFALPFEPPLAAAWIALPAVVGWIAMSRLASTAALVAVFAVLAALTTGTSLAILRADALQTPVITKQTRQLRIIARVERAEPAEKRRTRLLLGIHATVPSLELTPRRVRLSAPSPQERLMPGDWIEIRASLRPLPAPVAPGSYDFGRKLWFDGIGAVGFSFTPPKRIDPPRPPTAWEGAADAVERFRRSVSDRILAAMSPRAGPIAAAFLTGERGLISDEDNEAMRDSSLAHLLSISGLHMALAGFGFFAVLRLIFALIPSLALNYPVKKWAAGAALVASFGYLLLSGASVPTQRSFVMIAVALIAILFDRSALNMRTVAVAAAIVLAITPESWIDPSFQMSFAAVIALIAAYEWWNARRIPDAEPPSIVLRAFRTVGAAAATSFIAGIATAPFAAYHFNRFADYGVAANVLVMPVVSFVIMPAGVLALILMPFGLEGIPLAVMGQGIDLMLSVAHWVASWPGAAQAVAASPVWGLALIVAGGLWLAIWQAGWRWLGAAPIAAGLVLSLTARQPDFLIAGDGDNVAVRGEDGRLHMLSSRRGRFDVEIWLRRDGDSRDVADALKDRSAAFTCDATGCIANVKRQALAVAWSQEALQADCANAAIQLDLVRGWHPPCVGPKLYVNNAMLAHEGAIAGNISGPEIEWTSVARERGDRPWTGKPKSQ